MEASTIPVSNIYVREGFNPRRHFDETALESLTADIKARGLIQPIVVRREPTDDGEFHVVVGERRFRAVQRAGMDMIDAVVRECSLREALGMAVAENEKREGVSAGEESLAAQRVLDELEGDKALAAKELGWSRSKLDSRLLLLHATQEVLDALAKGEIYLGHAELLAGLPQNTQNGTLAKVISDKISVAELKRRIEGFAMSLASACFDTSGCNACPHNSNTQLGLFSEPVKEGLCQNRSCFNDKTQAALEEKKADLGEKFNIVVLATEKSDTACRALVKEGSQGVGHTQFNDCQQCAHFGARIENRLNGQTGTVLEGMCFNTACNDEKQAAYKKSLNKDQGAATAQSSSAPAKSSTSTSKGKKASSDIPKAAKVAISEQVRGRMPSITDQSDVVRQALIVEALAHRLGGSVEFKSILKDLPKDALKPFHSHTPSLSGLCALDLATLEGMARKLACAIPAQTQVGRAFDSGGFGADQLKRARTMLSAAEKTVEDVFEVDEAFLAALPKAAIAALLDEVGFGKWFIDQSGEDREKAYKALLANKKKDLPGAIMAAGFDWGGVIPKVVARFLRKPE
jgi:ParB family transcriptional regulator, chromosome partitioning protein